MSSLTPAMRQYLEIKSQYPDCILFFRMGDFYEMFFEDAVLASKLLEITLTSRNKGKEDSVPLCGFPWHAASSYIAKLIAKGYKVAVCEQMEDPRLAKGVVKREVVRVVTPGLVLDPDNLEAKQNNFLAGIALRGEAFGLAFLDVSTGEFRATEIVDRPFFLDEVIRHGFRELVLEEGFRDPLLETVLARELDGCVINRFPRDWFDHGASLAILGEHVGAESITRLEPDRRPALIAAAGAVLRYVRETQKERLGHINEIAAYRSESFLVLDETAKRNLELFATTQGGAKEGTLFHVLDETMTAMGGRRLRWWLAYPLLDAARIRERLAAVGEIREAHLARQDLRKALAGLYDMERLGARISLGVANGRDLAALRASLRTLPGLKGLLDALEAPVLAAIREGIDEMPETLDLLERAIVDEPPLTLREGGIIREGYDAELDRILSVSRDGKSWIAALEEKERQRTGIASLRVGFNNVFGYYIEVTKSQTAAVPAEYVRKQTLVNAERYINEELKEYEQTVLHAEEKRREREYELFVEIRERIAGQIRRIQKSASALADLDAITSLAEVAEKYNYCRPAVDDGDAIEIRDGLQADCDKNGIPDDCQWDEDHDGNGVPDGCDIAALRFAPGCSHGLEPGAQRLQTLAGCSVAGLDSFDFGEQLGARCAFTQAQGDTTQRFSFQQQLDDAKRRQRRWRGDAPGKLRQVERVFRPSDPAAFLDHVPQRRGQAEVVEQCRMQALHLGTRVLDHLLQNLIDPGQVVTQFEIVRDATGDARQIHPGGGKHSCDVVVQASCDLRAFILEPALQVRHQRRRVARQRSFRALSGTSQFLELR